MKLRRDGGSSCGNAGVGLVSRKAGLEARDNLDSSGTHHASCPAHAHEYVQSRKVPSSRLLARRRNDHEAYERHHSESSRGRQPAIRRRSECRESGRLGGLCAELGLGASVATIKKFQQLSSEPDQVDAKIVELVQELEGRLHDEMQEASFFSLAPHEATLYRRPLKGWERIVTRFPAVATDVEEAARCYALSRYAASTFHCLQVVEHGLIELGTFIDVADPQSGWTAVCHQMKKIIKTDYSQRTQFQRENFAFIEQVFATTEALKNAWRDKVSHAQGKLVLLTTDLTPQVAEEIMYASRAFMHRLVDGLPT
jgi:hypothetical protein